MTQQRRLSFDDPDSMTRDGGLSVVRAHAERIEPFDRSLFAGFESMRALTYTPSLPMIVNVLRDFRFANFECIFGHPGILPPGIENILAFQAVLAEQVSRAFVGVSTSDDRQQALFDLVADDTARFFVVKDKIAHAKIYLLEREGLCRVMVGSANLSETAFSGRQAETLVMFDNDDEAWRHYSAQYEAVRGAATSRLKPSRKPTPAEHVQIEEIPTLREVEESEEAVRMYVPPESGEEAEVSLPVIQNTVVNVAAGIRRSLAAVQPNRNGFVSITPRVVREAFTISRSRHDESDGAASYLSYDGQRFDLSGETMSLDADPW